MITDYLAALAAADRSPTTIGTRRQQLEQLARAVDVPPQDVTLDAITRYYATRVWATDTRRGHRNAAVSFFSWAHATGRIPADPAIDLPIIRPPDPAPRPAPDDAIAFGLRTPDRRVQLMLRLACEAGLRRAEVAQVHTDDLSDGIGGPVLRVHGKGRRIRTIPVSKPLADLIAAGASAHSPGTHRRGFLFPGQIDGHLSPRRVGELCADALPGDWTMHTLRHRFATRAYRGTRNLRAVQTLLGHSSVATTERYTAVDDDEVRSAMLAAA